MNHSNETDKIGPALVAFLGEVTNPAFDSTNPHFGSGYVSLAGLEDHIRPVAHKHGLGILQFPVGVGGVESVWMHTSGQWISEIGVFDLNPKNAQTAVATITYGRRAAMAAMAGVAGEADDDGESTSDRTSTPAPARPKADPPTPGSGLKTGPFTVIEVTHKDGVGKTTGKAYTVFTIRFSDGAEAKTFDKGLANIGKIASENGAPVTRMIERGKFGFDLKELKLVAAPEPDDGTPF